MSDKKDSNQQFKMPLIEKIKVTSGVYWIAVPEAGLYCLCGCPADSVKHLMKKGLIISVERHGVTFETGPNAILLSDVMVQKGHFSNLAEFPVLQMLYRQGLLLPDHPNNTGEKPVLIGTKEQIKAQMQYIYCGNYGLTSLEEIIETGIPQEKAREIMRLKLKFAFGEIKKSEDLLDSRIVNEGLVEIKDGVNIRRAGFNRYEFQYKGEAVEVDLNLRSNEEYESPYELGFYQFKREYFAVVHSGEGDGWDINGPTMASILVFQGKIYLIDAAPNILKSLTTLGVNISEIEGIFHTHAHDDHFAGLTTLIRSDHRIKYFATPLVRTSVAKKLASLMSWDQDYMDRYFEIHDLEFYEWNNIEGLEVKPIFSPHPVETNNYIFRTFWNDGYLTYAHLADIASLGVLENMVTEDSTKPGITRAFLDKIKSDYLTSVNLKKLDTGGGLIHGNAEDFREDTSKKIILSHFSSKLSIRQKEIGSSAPFGMVDVLIPSNQDYAMQNAFKLLRSYFPKVPPEDLRMLMNCSSESFNAGSILIKEGTVNSDIYLISNGIVEMIQSKAGVHRVLSVGSLVGEMSGIMEVPSLETYYAASYVRTLKIPGSLYHKFVEQNKMHRDLERVMDNRYFIQSTWLFGEMVSYPVQNKIAQTMVMEVIPEGQQIPTADKPELFMVNQGEIQIRTKDKTIETLNQGDFFGEETILFDTSNIFKIYTTKKSTIFRITGDMLMEIPIVQWKLLETLEKRLNISGITLICDRRKI